MRAAKTSEDSRFELSADFLWLRENGSANGFSPSVGDPYALAKNEVEILEAISRGLTRQEVIETLSVGADDLDQFIADILEWSPGTIRSHSPDNQAALADHTRIIEAARLRDIFMAMRSEEADNDTFHRTQLSNAEQQFDEIETTVSHVFRQPHEALNGRSYGQVFCDWLVATDRISVGCRVLEVGCGLGYFAKAILDELAQHHPKIYASIKYTMFDLSPELQSAQKRNCADHGRILEFLSGNIETHDFDGAEYDLILSNEVIADLSVATVSIDNIESASPQTPAEALVCEHGLECVPVTVGSKRMAVVNSGAIKMLKTVAGCLSESGQAVITEYGSNELSPKAVQLGNHLEFTVDFGHLQQVAEQLDMKTQRSTIGEVLDFDARSETIKLESLQTLNRCILPHLGHDPLPVLAYTPLSLRDAIGPVCDDIANIRFLPLSHPNAFSPFRFELLSLAKY